MPSAMAQTEPRDDNEALVTLTEVKDDGSTLGIKSRRAILNPRRKTLAIGRASLHKYDRQTSEDNALFQNPVVSRLHAEIEWEEISQSLFYVDTNSTHGSKINNKPVAAHKRQSLKAGDKITLGNFIHSRDKGFPPLHLQVGFKIGPPRSVTSAYGPVSYSHGPISNRYDSILTQPRQRVAAPAPWRMPATRGIPTYTVPDDSESDSASPEPSREPTYHEISDSEDDLMAGNMPSDDEDGVEESAQMLSFTNLPETTTGQSGSTANSNGQVGQIYLSDDDRDGFLASEDDEDDQPSSDEGSEASDEEEEQDIEDALLTAQEALLDETLLQMPLTSDTDMFMPTSVPLYTPVRDMGTFNYQPQGPSPTVSSNETVFPDLDEVIKEQNAVGGKGSIGYILQNEHTAETGPSTSTVAPAAQGTTEVSQAEAPASPQTPSRKRKLDDAMIDEIQEEVVAEMTTPTSDIVEAKSMPVDTLTESFASKSLKGQDGDGAPSAESYEAAQNISSDTQSSQPPTKLPPVPSVMETGPARKRLRRAAEAMGYFTLGGAAVLTALIATAPAL